jgi:hypothetical protein
MLVGLALGLGAAAPAAAVDWAALAGEETVVVVTADEDGGPRETTVWLAVVGDQGYLRTGGTTWGDNAERAPEITLRAGGSDHPLRAERVRDPALIDRVQTAMREKYGSSDVLSGWIRWGEVRIFRLAERTPAAPDAGERVPETTGDD